MEEYRVDTPWLIKIVIVILFIGVMAAIILDIASLIELWRHGHVLDIAMVALFLFGAPYILLIVLFTNTRFTGAGIVHTNFLLSKTRKRYDEIKTIEITRRSEIRLHFKDGTAIKVLTGEWYLQKTLDVLRQRIEA